MSMTLTEVLSMKREIRKRTEEEVARLERLLANARWKLECDDQDVADAEAAIEASKKQEATP